MFGLEGSEANGSDNHNVRGNDTRWEKRKRIFWVGHNSQEINEEPRKVFNKIVKNNDSNANLTNSPNVAITI